MTVSHRLLEGQVAVVTGGGGGPEDRATSVGAATSLLLARQGAAVVVVDIDPAGADATVAAIRAEGGLALAVVADLSREVECRRAVDDALAAHGRLDILINNVAVGGGAVLHEVEEDDWDRAMAINLKSALFMSKHAVPHMIDGGAVVNLSSLAVDTPPVGLAYPVSKAALEALTRSLALQYGPQGVRCNAVRPGEIWTALVDRHQPTPEAAEQARAAIRDRTALLTNGDAWDAAHAIVFMAGPLARWITGQVLVLDGGASLLRPDPNWTSGRSYWKAPR